MRPSCRTESCQRLCSCCCFHDNGRPNSDGSMRRASRARSDSPGEQDLGTADDLIKKRKIHILSRSLLLVVILSITIPWSPQFLHPMKTCKFYSRHTCIFIFFLWHGKKTPRFISVILNNITIIGTPAFNIFASLKAFYLFLLYEVARLPHMKREVLTTSIYLKPGIVLSSNLQVIPHFFYKIYM